MAGTAKRYTVHDPDTGAEITGTLEELARHFGANPNTIRTMMYSRGMGLEQALMTAPRGEEKLSVEVGGEIHQGTFRELCRKFGATPGAVRGRMRDHGMSLGEALAAPKRGVPRHGVIDPAAGEAVEGTLAELARRFGISTGTVKKRMSEGMTLQEALTAPKWMPKTREVRDPETGEIVKDTAKDLAERFGTDMGTVRRRMFRDGMPFQEAVTTPKRSFVEHEVLDPETGEAVTGTIRELSDRFGVGESMVRSRLRSGMPLQEALTRPRVRDVEYEAADPKTGEIVKGTIKALSRRFGVKESTVRARLRVGMDVQEALTKPVC